MLDKHHPISVDGLFVLITRLNIRNLMLVLTLVEIIHVCPGQHHPITTDGLFALKITKLMLVLTFVEVAEHKIVSFYQYNYYFNELYQHKIFHYCTALV